MYLFKLHNSIDIMIQRMSLVIAQFQIRRFSVGEVNKMFVKVNVTVDQEDKKRNTKRIQKLITNSRILLV